MVLERPRKCLAELRRRFRPPRSLEGETPAGGPAPRSAVPPLPCGPAPARPATPRCAAPPPRWLRVPDSRPAAGGSHGGRLPTVEGSAEGVVSVGGVGGPGRATGGFGRGREGVGGPRGGERETAGRKVGPDRFGRAGDVTGVVCDLGWPQLAGREEAAARAGGGGVGRLLGK